MRTVSDCLRIDLVLNRIIFLPVIIPGPGSFPVGALRGAVVEATALRVVRA